MVIEPIQIDTVEIRIGEPQPVRVSLHVTGVIGDGCADLLPPTLLRSGNLTTIRINRTRPLEAVCSQIAKVYDEVIPLLGEFPPGDYRVKVNSLERGFHVG